MNETKLWTQSLTKDILTTYAEGLACATFDQHINYNVIRLANDKWYVMHKDVGKHRVFNSTEPLEFDRLRIVTITNGYMSCTCGYEKRFLMPCRHMCAIINDRDKYTPDLFHIRWYTTYNYYFKRPFATSKLTGVANALTEMHETTLQTAFNPSTGEYRGVPVTNTAFLNSLPSFEKSQDVLESDIYKLMLKIYDATIQKPVIRGTITMHEGNEETSNDMEDDVLNIDDVDDTIIPATMGGNSQITAVKTIQRLAMDDEPTPSVHRSDIAERRLMPVFQEAMATCTSGEQIDRLFNAITHCYHQNLADAHSKNSKRGSGTQIFGEGNYTKKKQPRRKYGFEIRK